MAIRKGSFVLLAILTMMIYSASQNPGADYSSLLKEYRQAGKYYDQATAIGSSPSYSEEKEMEWNRKALQAYTLLLQKFPTSPPYQDSLRYWTSFRVGELHHYFDHFNEALKGYDQAIDAVKRSALIDSLLFRPYLYSGILCYHQNRYDSANSYFQKAETILAKYKYQLVESERLYNTIGVLHYEKGDYRQARNYFQKALEVLPLRHPYYQELMVNYQVNLAQMYFKMEDYNEANRIYETLLSRGINSNEIQHNLGLINLSLGATSRSLQYFRKVSYSSNKKVWLYSNMAEAFLSNGQYDSTEFYLQKAITSSNSFSANTDHVALGLAYRTYGEFSVSKKLLHDALSWYQRALHQFYPAFQDTTGYSNPNSFSGVFSYINLFHTLVAKSETMHELYRTTRDLSWARRELDAYEAAFSLVEYVERTYESDEARLFLDKSKYIIHSKPIDIAYELYEKTKEHKFLEQLYHFDQRNKASILSIKMHATAFPHQDSSFLQQERNIKSEISRLSITSARINDSIAITQINNKVRDLEIELERIRENPKEANKNFEQIPSIAFLQNELLEKGSALISFHLSKDKLTTLLISRQNIQCRQEELPSGFLQSVESFINNIKSPTSSLEDKGLYEFLFHDLKLDDIDRLIIIPDDELNYLSFESLHDKDGKYLIEKYAVQYQYTTALLRKEKINFGSHETLAMAPFANHGYEDSSFSLEVLPNSATEIKDIKGLGFIDSQATKSNLLKHIQEYPVLHLATHAILNHQNGNLSFISLSPQKNEDEFLLYGEEIYHLPLQQTRLVILTACETGSGKLVKGEGIMSLSRAFTYAGCPNIITSLWVANDLSTSYLANKVHVYLNKGLPVDKALHQAKMDYLSDRTIHPRMKHPYYWSHLVFIGNYGVEENEKNWMFWILPGIGILLLGAIFIKKFRAGRNRVSHR